ncbi:hypothetical protein KP509_11G049200 [Ceratopteris richardii]|nr:hypothetical protein KP509_11G049200 [Ceratopteris richardii]
MHSSISKAIVMFRGSYHGNASRFHVHGNLALKELHSAMNRVPVAMKCSASAAKYLPHGFARGRHFTQYHHHQQSWHMRMPGRSYSCAHLPRLEPKLMNLSRSKEFRWFYWWRIAYERLSMNSHIVVPRLPNVGALAKAVSLACTWAHLPLGIVAFTFGGSKIAHLQGKNNVVTLSSNHSSSILIKIRSFMEFCSLVTRSLYLLLLFTPVVLTAPFVNMFGGYFRQSWFKLVHHTLEFAGAAFIKWGQWAATRPDLFPKDLCAQLAQLQSNAPAHKYSYTVKSIENAFGKPLDEIFLDFEEKPVASGSIAQVYKATLRNGAAFGKQKGPMTVAVKVRHPGVSDVIRRDFAIMNCFANLSTLFPGLRWLRLDESVHQFAVFMMTQVDLAREAAHLSRFSYNFRSWRDVSFPRPVYPLVHPAVLVESFEQGESVSNYIDLPDNSKVNRKLAYIGTNTVLKMLLVDNFIHADMHPGNILVRLKKKGTEDKKRRVSLSRNRPQLVFLDVGLTAELTQKDRTNLLDFFKAITLRDGRTAAQCALAFSENQSCPNPTAFTQEMETSFQYWGTKEADIIHPGECMQEVLEKVRTHKVNIDGDVCTVMVTIMVLEGWQRKLDPDFNIMQTLQKLLLKKDMKDSLSYTMNAIMAP